MDSVQGQPVVAPGAGPKKYPGGRVCLEFGCGTVLSIYNRSLHCWQHIPIQFGRNRAPRSTTAS